MRIESLVPYKYFFQIVKEEPIQLKSFTYLLLVIPLIGLCFLLDWNKELLLFIAFGFLSAGVGFFVAYKSSKKIPVSFKKRVYQKFILDHISELVILVENQSQKIVYANTAFYSTLGFESDRISDIRFEDFIDSKDLYLFQKQSSKKIIVPSFNKTSSKIKIHTQGGASRWMEFDTERNIENGDFTMYTLKDSTDQQLLEKATSQFAADLLQRKQKLNKIKKKEAEVILMMNINRAKRNMR